MITTDKSYDDQFSSMGSAVAGLWHEMSATVAGKNALTGHPGRSIDIFKHGLPRLEAHASATGAEWDWLRRAVGAQFDKGTPLCESPIERNMLAALLTGGWPSCPALGPEPFPMVHNAKDYSEAFPRHPVVIVPQMALLRYRVDLGIVAQRYDGAVMTFGIECDGKAFHQDTAKDRERDAYFGAIGLKLMRVSGRVANEAPIAIADAIINKIDGMLR